MIPIAEFEEMFRSRCKLRTKDDKLSEVRPGLRSIRFSGDLLETALDQDDGKAFIESIFAALPSDVMIHDLDGRLLHMVPAFISFSGGYLEQYMIVVASRKWPPLEEGGLIPQIQFVANRQDGTKAYYERSTWSLGEAIETAALGLKERPRYNLQDARPTEEPPLVDARHVLTQEVFEGEITYSYDRTKFRLVPVREKCTDGREAFKLVSKEEK